MSQNIYQYFLSALSPTGARCLHISLLLTPEAKAHSWVTEPQVKVFWETKAQVVEWSLPLFMFAAHMARH